MPTGIISAAHDNIEQQLLSALQLSGPYTIPDMLINMALALVLGLLLASVYRYTHKGLSYSQSFTLTIVMVTTIVAITLMAIESSLARAFALVGALSIIRFRTVVKDTKDTAFVFAGLAVGIAAGTSNHALAILGAVFICLVSLILHRTNFGATADNQFMIRFIFDSSHDRSLYEKFLGSHCRSTSLLSVEPSQNGQYLATTIDIKLKRATDKNKFASEFARLAGISDVNLLVAKSGIDY